MRTKKYYVWKKADACIMHNHSLNPPAAAFDGKQFKSSIKELTPEEEKYAREIGGRIDLYHFCELMNAKFPETDISNRLLDYLNQEGKKTICAQGGKINDLLSYGKKIEANGGIFGYECDGDARICEIYIQSNISKKYLAMYGDLLIMDGTHNTNINAMTLIPLVVVDAFGKTGIGGYIFGHYEEHETMINGLRTFGIGNGNGISLLTDGGSAFEACADIYNFQHILCTYHFTLNVFATTSKMSNDMKHWYLQICGDLVFHPFDNETTWYSKWNDLHEKLVEFPNAMSYITKMYSQLIAKVHRDLSLLIL
jgi:hypothetical protein